MTNLLALICFFLPYLQAQPIITLTLIIYVMAKLTQEELLDIFHAVMKEVKPYEKGYLKPRIDIEGKYDLWTEKPGMVAAGRAFKELSLVAVIVQSNYVGFYFMPVYTTEAVKAQLHPDLLKTLKGKACFHIKTTDKELMKHIKAAMKTGSDAYKANGWV